MFGYDIYFFCENIPFDYKLFVNYESTKDKTMRDNLLFKRFMKQ